LRRHAALFLPGVSSADKDAGADRRGDFLQIDTIPDGMIRMTW
jgi:hypothetical protein